MHYQPITDAERQEFFKEIGISSFADLLQGIPANLRNPKLEIPEALSEFEVQELVRQLGSLNATARDHLSFLGGGSYDHFIPTAVPQITGRNEFYTAYTPYQPEAAQGTLQSIYEYQSMITELTGLDVSNASHYDGATSAAEAALLACRHTDRTKILVARSVHPHYRRVIKTYVEGTPYSVAEFGFDGQGHFDRKEFLSLIGPDVAGAVFQTPNFFGIMEDLEGVADKLHEAGCLFIVCANPISMAVLKSPGEWGADVAVGEGQPLGIPVSFGGPYLGYFSTTRALMRRIPGRLAGMTKDSEGKRAFCLTLQAREQHIRRERAASNICTNQALCALAACVYMTLMGKEGIKELAEINMDRAYYLREQISKVKGFKVDLQTPIFNEFIVEAEKDFVTLESKLMAKKIFPGIDVTKFYPDMKNRFLVCATETKTKADLDRFVKELAAC
jgi:glycine dehydrogenase subunit 1